MLQERIHGSNDRTNVGFRAHAADSRLSGLFGQLLGEMNCDHQDGNFREKLENFPSRVNPVHVGHLKVQQDHIRGICPHSVECLVPRSSLATDSPGILLFEQAAQKVPNRRVVIRQ